MPLLRQAVADLRKASMATDRQRAKSAAAVPKPDGAEAAGGADEGEGGGTEGGAAPPEPEEEKLSDYERARREQMEKNRAMMESLGLISVSARASEPGADGGACERATVSARRAARTERSWERLGWRGDLGRKTTGIPAVGHPEQPRSWYGRPAR